MKKSRTPSEALPARIDPLARLPVFLALDGKRAVVAGGSAAAAWKAELMSAAGADVTVYAEAPSEELLQIAADPPRGAIAIRRDAWVPGDLAGAAVAVGACEDEANAAAFAAAARAAAAKAAALASSSQAPTATAAPARSPGTHASRRIAIAPRGGSAAICNSSSDGASA